MKKIRFKNKLESLAFCVFFFLFAMQPALERIGISDYVIWGLMLICIVVALLGFVQNVRKEGKKYFSGIRSRDLYDYLETTWCLLGLIISYYLNSQMIPFWIVLTIMSVTACLIPSRPRQPEA